MSDDSPHTYGSDQLDIALTILTLDVRREVERLRAIEKWAHRKLKVAPGGQAVIKRGVRIDTNNGWRPWREVLQPGCTGTVGDLFLSVHNREWICYFTPDVQWTLDDDGWERKPAVRHLVATPASFMFRVGHLRKRKATDEPFRIPGDARSWS